MSTIKNAIGKPRKIKIKAPPVLVEAPAELLRAGRRLPIYVNYGMGVESEAALEKWIEDPSSRYFALGGHRIPFDWDQVTLVSSQTGGEDRLTKYLVTQFTLPRLRDLEIRFVQVARAGPLQSDGIVILSDTRAPDTLYIEGAYTLQDELLATGTVPQFAGGRHLCSLKTKRDVVEPFVNFDLNEPKVCEYPRREDVAAGQQVPPVLRFYNYNAGEQARIRESDAAIREHNLKSCGIAFSYNSNEGSRISESDAAIAKLNEHYGYGLAFAFNRDEQSRITEAKTYDIAPRVGIYPLELWGWSRERCLDYIRERLGVLWHRSRCSFCPFNSLTASDIERHKLYPEELSNALLIEYIALAMNPRATLYKTRSLYEIAVEHQMSEGLRLFDEQVKAAAWSLYRVRRIYNAKGGDPHKKGQTDRCVERLDTGTREAMQRAFQEKAKGLLVESHRLHLYAYVRHRAAEELYPTAEEYFVACPNTVQTKARYGVEWFDEKWYRTVGFDPSRASAGQLGLSF